MIFVLLLLLMPSDCHTRDAVAADAAAADAGGMRPFYAGNSGKVGKKVSLSSLSSAGMLADDRRALLATIVVVVVVVYRWRISGRRKQQRRVQLPLKGSRCVASVEPDYSCGGGGHWSKGDRGPERKQSPSRLAPVVGDDTTTLDVSCPLVPSPSLCSVIASQVKRRLSVKGERRRQKW